MYKKYGKRVFDFCFSLVGVILCLPLFLIVICAIKTNSSGPVLFKQLRMGKNGKLFLLYKFRTMIVDPEKEKICFEPGNNTRVTSVGNFLRKTKIDELPQLFNVLRGDMSLVGPRPEIPKYRKYYTDTFENILSVKPGITDEASIKFINEEKILEGCNDPEKTYTKDILQEKLRINSLYAGARVSFVKDLFIILKTVKNIFIHVKV